MKEVVETYNLINYLKIIDVSLLNLFDYCEIQNDQMIVEQNGKLILNFSAKTRKMLESLIIRNINDSVFFNKINIVVNTCLPKENWRTISQKSETQNQKYVMKNDSIYIDEIKLNSFLNEFFRKLETTDYLDMNSKKCLVQNSVKFIEFKSIDVNDAFIMITSILENFGHLKLDDFNYNIISDGNHIFSHNEVVVSELLDEVRIMLINKGVI